MYSSIKDFIAKHTRTYKKLTDEPQIEISQELKKIFVDTTLIPEKNNSKYVADVTEIPDIHNIINKTYTPDHELDDHSKECHELLKNTNYIKLQIIVNHITIIFTKLEKTHFKEHLLIPMNVHMADYFLPKREIY